MSKRSLLLAGIFALAVTAACSKLSVKSTYEKQATYIEGFVSAQMSKDPQATLTRNGGAFRLTLHDTLDRVFGQRDSLRQGGTAVVWYACYTLTGSTLSASNLVATNIRLLANSAGWELSDTLRYKPDTLRLDGKLVRGLQEGLFGVQQYDECFILFTGEFGFGNNERGTIPARSALAYQFWIENIDNEN